MRRMNSITTLTMLGVLVLAVCAPSASATTEWMMEISAEMAGDPPITADLTYGASSSATDGYDEGLDENAPLADLSGFDAYFDEPGVGYEGRLKVNMKSVDTIKNWTLMVFAPKTKTVNVSWMPGDILFNVDMQIQELDLDTSEPIGSAIDMKAHDLITITGGTYSPTIKRYRITATTSPAAEPPELVSCVIDPTPPVVQGTNVSVDCLFSERVEYEIRIENETGLVEEIGSGTATNPNKKWWYTTTETPTGTYIVNVTMYNSTSGLSSYNDTNTIEVTAAPAEKPIVSIGSAEGRVGDTVSVSINITGASGIGAMDINITYDPTILNGTDVANGSMIESLSEPQVAYHISSGRINISFATYPDAIDGDGELFIVTFEVAGGNAGDNTTTVLGVEAYTTDVPPQPVMVETENGVVNVTSADTTPPAITDVACDTPTTDSVTITWTTDEDSDSLVKYGNETGVYTGNVSDTTMVTSHSITLTGLTPETTYYFVVNSTDASDNPAESAEYNFTTAAEAEAVVTITDWTLDATGTCGTSIDATVNITNTGTETLWFVVSVSGTQAATGYPLVGLGTVQLAAGASIDAPVKIVVPGSADTGDYTLTPVVYRLDEYPAGAPKAIGSGKSVTIS